ncbi:MAG: hypothetical protein HY711_00810, partial [Candidatus Melainabacteria bacterium]|nr:hypothetical protein [Candidatus Melainabacteria bacterium]
MTKGKMNVFRTKFTALTRSACNIVAALVFVSILTSQAIATTGKAGISFAGLEYYGSSQLTRMELEKLLGLKLGAPFLVVAKAVERLHQQLELRHIDASIQMISASAGRVFVVVDVSDSSTAVAQPTRRLKFPRHVDVTSERPFLLLDKLDTRLARLTEEGRTWSETLKEGLKYYTDEAANLIVGELVKQVPDMRAELLTVISSDPDPNRRKAAAELLN